MWKKGGYKSGFMPQTPMRETFTSHLRKKSSTAQKNIASIPESICHEDISSHDHDLLLLPMNLSLFLPR